MNAEVWVRELADNEWAPTDAEPAISFTQRWRALGGRQKLVLGGAAFLVVLVNAAAVWSYVVCV